MTKPVSKDDLQDEARLGDICISPAAHARVYHENGQLLGEAETVIWSAWWERRFLDGDIHISDQLQKGKSA